MKKINIIILVLMLLYSCSNTEKYRTRFTDKNMRLMVDPASLSTENYIRLQTSLVQQQMWTVLDRKAGLEAIKKEQDELHKKSQDRYLDKEKFAHWGKLYGVGAVIVGHTQCFFKMKWFSVNLKDYYCDQMLNLVDANTGEVIIGVEGGQYTEGHNVAPDWKELVSKLADAYPKEFIRQPSSEKFELYKSESEEEAKRLKEK